MDDAQDEVIAFLRDASSYPPGSAPVEVIETHASLVFLAGDYAYKLKRAVKYPYLDFSTLPQRLAACTAELKLNRRTAPQLYLEVRPISRRADGTLAWYRVGTVVDYVVVMRRFAQSALLDAVAQHGELAPPLLFALTAHIAAFHDKAEKRPDRGGAAAVADLVETNIRCLRQAGPPGFAAAQVDMVEAGLRRELAQLAPLLDARREAGEVRRCHGDLHLRNVCLIDGEPVLFDCIEFSEQLASIDVLYDLAFLLMDLDHRGYRGFANLVANRYLDLTGEDDGIAALPLFVALRAVIRAHVTATTAAHGWGGPDLAAATAEAARYVDEAAAALEPQPPRLVAIGGLSGSGKSTLAARLAPELGRRPGARVLRSDVLRKLRFGSEPETPLPPMAYTAEISAAVYRDLYDKAAAALRAGASVVIDAVSLRPEERRAFPEVAAAARVPFTGIWLEAPSETMATRLGGRHGDASDASPEILAQQLALDPGALDWIRLDGGGDPDMVLAAARRALLH